MLLFPGISPQRPGFQYHHMGDSLGTHPNNSLLCIRNVLFRAPSKPPVMNIPQGPRIKHPIPRSPWTQMHIMTHTQLTHFNTPASVTPLDPADRTCLGAMRHLEWEAGCQESILRTLLWIASLWDVLEPSSRSRLSHGRNHCGLEHLTIPIMGKPPWPRDTLPFMKGPSWTETPT